MLFTKTLCVPDDLFERYYQDSLKITKQSLINITISNGNYSLKPSVASTKAMVFIIVGEKEIGIMRKSAELLHKTINTSRLHIAKEMEHRAISLANPEKYIELLEQLFRF